ncbi:MAG: hypothetical protein KAX30_04790 [Candidatus Atribacteria bacterium]|nr:hypothetical protein [Candidatus Atribacteria bacterium]
MGRETSKVRGEIGVRVWTTATIYVANEVMRVFFIILDQRGLPNSKLNSQKEVITNGLFTWITTRYLKAAFLELYGPGENKAVERWDLGFRYEEPTADIDPENSTERQFKTYIEKIYEIQAKLNALPEGTEYRVVVNLEQGAPAVEGWQPTTLKDISHLEKHNIGEMIDTGLINVGMEYWGKIRPNTRSRRKEEMR